MNSDTTHITVILDRSGSMQSIRDDIIGGFNSFLEQQKKEDGKATLSLVQFDSADPYEVLNSFQPLDNIVPLSEEVYVPRGSTPLLDALGRGINELAQQLAGLKEEDRPTKVVFVVVTDGMENASQEFTKAQIVQMIQEKTDKADWQFVFLSADMGAVMEARGIGVHHDSSMYYRKTAQGTAKAFSSLSKRTAEYRKGEKHKVGFDQEDAQDPEK